MVQYNCFCCVIVNVYISNTTTNIIIIYNDYSNYNATPHYILSSMAISGRFNVKPFCTLILSTKSSWNSPACRRCRTEVLFHSTVHDVRLHCRLAPKCCELAFIVVSLLILYCTNTNINTVYHSITSTTKGFGKPQPLLDTLAQVCVGFTL